MISDAQHAANKANAAHSTGPQTPTGKARSSKNRLTLGLFTINDFVREDEAESYTRICTSLWTELSPATTLEEAFSTEILSATWRLRRCRMVEEDIAQIAVLDPMQDPATAAQQKSVDRARANSLNIFNRCINALRKLQTERGIRSQGFGDHDVPEGMGLMDIRQVAKTKPFDVSEPAQPAAAPAQPPVAEEAPTGFDALMALADKQLAQRYRDYGMAAFTGAPAPAAPATASPSSLKHPSDLIPTQSQSQTSSQWSMEHVSDLIRTEAQSQTSSQWSTKHVSDLIRTEAQSQTSSQWSTKHVSDLIRTGAQSQTSSLWSTKHVSDLIRTEAQSQTSSQWSMGSNCKPAAAPPSSAKNESDFIRIEGEHPLVNEAAPSRPYPYRVRCADEDQWSAKHPEKRLLPLQIRPEIQTLLRESPLRSKFRRLIRSEARSRAIACGRTGSISRFWGSNFIRTSPPEPEVSLHNSGIGGSAFSTGPWVARGSMAPRIPHRPSSAPDPHGTPMP